MKRPLRFSDLPALVALVCLLFGAAPAQADPGGVAYNNIWQDGNGVSAYAATTVEGSDFCSYMLYDVGCLWEYTTSVQGELKRDGNTVASGSGYGYDDSAEVYLYDEIPPGGNYNYESWATHDAEWTYDPWGNGQPVPGSSWGNTSADIYVSGTPLPPQITLCPVPSPPWGPGSNWAVIEGSGFSDNTAQVSWSGNGGVNFLQSNNATVTSDSQIDLSVSLLPVTSDGSITVGIGTAACVIPVLAAAPPPSCGDVRDQIIQEYLDYGVNLTPQCSWFTQTAHSEYFLFSELKVDNPYSWALIRQPLTVDKSSGYGLDRWRQLWGAARISNSGYRSPYHNAHLDPPGAPQSRHMWGDAIDLRNESRTEEEYNVMASKADRNSQQPNAGADYVEPMGGPCGLGCVHADWRNTSGPYSQ